MNQMTIEGVTYHPTFLYESMWNIVGLNYFTSVAPGRNLKRGEMFLVLSYLVFIWTVIYRRNAYRQFVRMVTLRAAQVVSIVTIVVAIIVFVMRRYVQKVDETITDE